MCSYCIRYTELNLSAILDVDFLCKFRLVIQSRSQCAPEGANGYNPRFKFPLCLNPTYSEHLKKALCNFINEKRSFLALFK